MKSNQEIKDQVLNLLRVNMDPFEIERFFSIILEEKFDYTKWRENLHQEFSGKSLEEISQTAMQVRENLKLD